jgi:hypothetical protein
MGGYFSLAEDVGVVLLTTILLPGAEVVHQILLDVAVAVVAVAEVDAVVEIKV